MKITFLGTGSAFVTSDENYHSNILIENEGKKLLYDAGTTINDALYDNGTRPEEIDDLFISHLHGDHSGGVEFLGFKTFFSTLPFGENKIKIIGGEWTLLNLWERQHMASMSSLDMENIVLNTFFDTEVVTFEQNKETFTRPFRSAGVNIQPISTDHTKYESYGIFIKDHHVFISGDTKFTPEKLEGPYHMALTIFHECEFKDYEGSYHSQFRDLKTLPADIKKKMHLYHYSLEEKTFEELEKEVLGEGFAGLVKRGQAFEF